MSTLNLQTLICCVALQVGSRTTVRVLNTQHIGFHEFEDEMLLQHATNQHTMEAVLVHRLKHADATAMFITDGDFHQYVLDEMGDGAASNGFYGVVFAKEMCKSVTLYGFYKARTTTAPASRVYVCVVFI
jgi:hypothetical protein